MQNQLLAIRNNQEAPSTAAHTLAPVRHSQCIHERGRECGEEGSSEPRSHLLLHCAVTAGDSEGHLALEERQFEVGSPC